MPRQHTASYNQTLEKEKGREEERKENVWGIGGRVRCFVFAWLGMLGRLHIFFQPRLGESSQVRGSRIFLGFAKPRKEARHQFYDLLYFGWVTRLPCYACSGFLDPNGPHVGIKGPVSG